MEIEKLVSPAPDIVGDTWAQRLDYAASILFVHGYIPQGQREKITQKMEKQFEQGIKSGRIIPREGQSDGNG